jgi:flagellar hook-associated protein 2
MSVSSVPPSSGSSGSSSVAPSSTSTATPASIIQQIGIGTTLPISAILAGLLNIDSIPLVNLQNQVTGINTELSAYAQLSLSLSTFQEAVQQLTLPTEFGTLTATSSNTSVLSATAVSGAAVGNESIDVTALAQAQSIATAGQASQSTSLATGNSSSTVTFTFGTENAATSTSPASFTANTALASGSITIDSSNDTLAGIRDTINNANLGVTAQIVNNGSTSQLVITSASGASQAVHISVSGDSGISSLLTYPPATGTTNGPTETQAGQDAALTINGVSVTSPTNSITSSIPDLSLTLTATGTTTLTVAQDNSTTQTNIDNFVSAYNVLQTEISSLTAFNAGTGGTNGPLIGDSTTLNVQSSLQNILASALTGTGANGLTTLASVGVTLNADGTLSVADSVLSAALSANPAAITALFATSGTSTSSNLTYLVAGSAAQQGSYAVNVTHQATSATAVGNSALGTTTTFASNTSLSISLDGVNASVTIPAGTYSPSGLASELQGLINSNSSFQAGGLATNVSINSSGELSIAGTDFGSTATINVSGDADTLLFGSNGATVTAGSDVQGTIGGIAATGQGQTLTGNKGTSVDGLAIQVTGGGTGNVGTINFSQGYAAQLNTALTSALATTGPIAAAQTNLNNQITALQTQETATQAFIASEQAQMQAEFSALDATLADLQNQSSFLQQTFNPTTTSS